MFVERLVLLLFFASGLTGLLYETLWQKQMFVLLGASAPAVTAVLGAFFAGISVGGRIGDRALRQSPAPPLRLYALAELAIAANALLMPWIQSGLHTGYLSAAHALGATSPAAYAFRFAVTMLAVCPATVAMGATIPIMAAALRDRTREAVATAYGVNAFGAMAGALLGSFVLVPALGIRGALLAALAVNLAVAGIAWRLAGRRPARTHVDAGEAPVAAWSFVYFGAGAVALGAETVWLRILALLTTNGTILFSLTLAVFLGAYALGSLVLHPPLARRLTARSEAAWVQLSVALAILATIPLIRCVPAVFEAWVLHPVQSGRIVSTAVLMHELLAVFAVVALPSIAMGMVFPAMARATRAAGTLYFWGNLGSLAGVLLFGLVLVPAAGILGSLLLLAALSALLGLSLRLRDGRAWTAALAAVAAAAVAWNTLPPFTRTTFAVKRLPDGTWGEFQSGRLANHILRYREGQSATIAIRDAVGANGANTTRRVFVDEQIVASTDPYAVVDSKMLAHLPALLHPAPRRALSVGYGSGGTSWSLALHELEARTVEIEREVLNAAPLFPYGLVWSRPNFRAIHNDARDHLQTTDERYDFISTDVTNMQYKQNSSLYTVEYFRLMRDRLTSDGIACAWIPMAGISLEEFRTLLRSFQDVYPHATLWVMNEIPTAFGILIGTPGPLSVDAARLGAGMARPTVRDDLLAIGIEHPLQIPAALLLDERGLRAFVAGAPRHTDDDPVLEHAATFSFYLFLHHFAANLDAALAFRPAHPDGIVAGLDAAQTEEFRRLWRASRRWYEVLALQTRAQLASDPADRLRLARRAVDTAHAAAQDYAGVRSWGDWSAQLAMTLKELEHAPPADAGAGSSGETP